MKLIAKISTFFLCVILLASCFKDRENIVPDLNQWGLTGDISDIVPDEIVEEMIALGMPVFGGANPPDFTNATYRVNPIILLASNRSNDEIGKKYKSKDLILSGYNNEKLTIMVKEITTSSESTGIGSFLVGQGNQFSIFTAIHTINDSGSVANSVRVISGTLSSNGIADLHESVFMVDDYGDVNNDLIEIGDGRVFYDSDGFSPRI